MFWGKLAPAERKQTLPSNGTLTFSRIPACTCENEDLKKKIDRVQDPQNTEEVVKMVTVEKKIKTSVVARLLNIERRREPYDGT